MFATREFRKGKVIVRQGTHGTSAFLLKKGRVVVTREDAQGNKKVITELGENDLFGEMAMINDEPRTASVTALEDCIVFVLPREKFLALPDNNPTVIQIKKIMSERIKQGK